MDSLPRPAAGVTALITRYGTGGAEVLVIERPAAGLLFPACTVGQGDDLALAVRREAATETGLVDLELVTDFGWAPTDPSRRLFHFHAARRMPEEWWVLVDHGGAHCNRCFWLPLDEAARCVRPDVSELLVSVVDAVAAEPGRLPIRLQPLFDDASIAPGAHAVAWQGRWFLQRWLPRAIDAEPERVQAFAVTSDGHAVLVSSSISGGDWGLPGGGIEPGEGVLEALAREIAEETCGRLVDSEYLGCYEGAEPLAAAGPAPSFQAKFWARVELDAFVPRFEIRQLRLVPYRDAPDVLTAWRQPATRAFLAAGVAAEDGRRSAAGRYPPSTRGRRGAGRR
jgi:8-oxo-dGTP pyrophosphatase MutT (NUDIX family)